ncbi:PorV/PorQ family protein [bacterium]|nr:MAG: PorV/PorQ family protein [bacterium]
MGRDQRLGARRRERALRRPGQGRVDLGLLQDGGAQVRGLALALALAAAAAAPCAAFGSGDKGTSAAAFLKVPAGARAAAMGDAYGGLDGGALGAVYNPAALGFLEAVELSATHDTHFQDLASDVGVLAVPLLSLRDTRQKRSAWGAAALSVRTLGASGIERRGVVETDAPTDTFGASDYAYGLSYGRALGAVALGGTVKLVEQSLDSARGRAAAVDGGVLWRGGAFSLGGGWRHFGQALKLGSTPDPLPFTLYGGGAWRPAPGVLAAVEVRAPRDDEARVSVGGELSRQFSGFGAAVRGGWSSAGAEAEGLGGLTAGAGATWGRFTVDFAWVPYGDLGSAYLTTVGFKF